MYTARFTVVEPYVKNFLKQNYWKIKTLMDWDDALSEARLQFVRTIRRLEVNGSVIENDAHVMSLFKTSWSRHFITLANKATQQRFVAPLSDATHQQWLMDNLADDDALIALERQIQTAPAIVRKIVKLLQSVDDEKFKQLNKMFYRDRSQCNRELCRQLGKDPNTDDLVEQVLNHLGI